MLGHDPIYFVYVAQIQYNQYSYSHKDCMYSTHGLRVFSGIENARPISAFIFIVAALTDWLDGWVAREFNQTSKLGAFLDPVADKLIVCIALLMIVQSDPTMINTLVSIVIIGREISISALREWMAELGERHQVSVIAFSKFKTILQMAGLSCMLYQDALFGIILT